MGSPVSGPFLSQGYDNGTPLDWFDLQMAMAPGMSENTRLAQLAKALAYWQLVQAQNQGDSNLQLKATFAITWIMNEQTRVSTPPANSFHLVYPV